MPATNAIEVPASAVDPAAFTPPDVLPIAHVRQANYQYLCWAACCAMVSDALVRTYPEHFPELPTSLLGVAEAVQRSGRCEQDWGTGIDRTCWPDCACGVLGFPCTVFENYVDAEWLADEIVTSRRPVCAYIEWHDGNSHVVLIVGCYPDKGVFVVHDPKSSGVQELAHRELVTFKGTGRWTRTYHNLGYSL